MVDIPSPTKYASICLKSALIGGLMKRVHDDLLCGNPQPEAIGHCALEPVLSRHLLRLVRDSASCACWQ